MEVEVEEVNDLPDEMWVAVFGLLEAIHTSSVTLTCRRWRSIFHSDPQLWRRFHETLIGGPRFPAVLKGPPALPRLGMDAKQSWLVCELRMKKKLWRAIASGVFDDDDGWRRTVEFKVKCVRKWGGDPAGRLEWAALLGCDRLLITQMKRYQRELSATARLLPALARALNAAIRANSLECAEFLLERGARHAGEVSTGDAIAWDNRKMLQLLRDKTQGFSLPQAVLKACEFGAADCMQFMIESSSPYVLTTLTDMFIRPLERAAGAGHVEIFRTVFNHYPCSTLFNIEAALLAATGESHDELIDLLLDQDVAPYGKNLDRYFNSRRPSVRVLMRLIRSVPEEDVARLGWTNLLKPWLNREDRLQVYRLLQSRGMDLSKCGQFELTTAQYALSKGEVEIAECLMECGVEPFYLSKMDAETARRVRQLLIDYLTESLLQYPPQHDENEPTQRGTKRPRSDDDEPS